MANAPVYRAEDRSLLLPYYKRFLVEPTLPFIPARIHPNSITHAGHLINLAAVGLLLALRPQRGWVFVASMLLLQTYLWADNADGAHARRTKQSSAFGEFLDHGLDILNTVYISVMTCFAIGAGHEWAIAMTILIPAAASVTCWEQTQTGVYRLGLLNQIESICVLSITMIISAIWGTDVWRKIVIFGPLNMYQAMMIWPASTIIFGMLRAMWRVRREGASPMPAVAFLSMHAAVFTAGALGHLSTVVAVTFATAVNCYFGARMLSLRLRGDEPKIDAVLLVGTVGMLGYVAYVACGLSVGPRIGIALATIACSIFFVAALRSTRDGIETLQRVEAGAGK